jgi:hypothetical protein
MRAEARKPEPLGGTAGDIVSRAPRWRSSRTTAAADPEVGIAVLTYTVTYREDLTEAAPVDDFLRVDAKHSSPAASTDTPVAEDLFNVRTP